jgi:hypothetical protein
VFELTVPVEHIVATIELLRRAGGRDEAASGTE